MPEEAHNKVEYLNYNVEEEPENDEQDHQSSGNPNP